jgi:uncharacterized protein (TIGR02147 family)
MDIFEFDDYKKFVEKYFVSMPKRGHGQLKKLAAHLNVHTTFVSQVFNGDKSISPEQGLSVAEYLGLNELETDYFIKLIQIDRAGSEKYKKLLLKELTKMKEHSQKISSRLDIKKILPDEQKAVFYSDWYYSAIRLLIGIEGHQDLESISKYLGLNRKTVSDAINFLLESGLLVREKNELLVGPSKTHLDADSPFIKLHHLNWRYKALEYIKHPYPEKLHYSSPMTIGKKEVLEIRNELVKTIERVG